MGIDSGTGQAHDGDRVKSGFDMESNARDRGNDTSRGPRGLNDLDHKMRTIIVAVFSILALTISLLAMSIYFLIFDDNPPFEIYNNPVPTEKTVYRTGELLRLKVEFCRWSDSPYTVYGQFEDGIVYSIPPREIGGTEANRCSVVYTPGVPVPETLPPGIYHYIGRTVYHVNPLADRVVTWRSQPFEIIE